MTTNHAEIFSEIEEQKADLNAQIAELTDQLAGLTLLEQLNTTTHTDANAGCDANRITGNTGHDVNLNINVTTTPTVSTATTDTTDVAPASIIMSSSTSVPGQPTETSPVIGTSRVKSVRHG